MTDGQSGSPRRSARAIKRYVEGIPKSTENKALTGFEILSHQKSEHLELDEQLQPTGQGVIKNPDSVGGKSITEYRIDGLDSRLIQVENYLEMIATRLCNDLPSQDKHEIRAREETLNETSPRKRRRIQPQNDHVSDDDRVSLWLVMNLTRQKRKLSLRKTTLPEFSTLSLPIKTSGNLMRLL